MNNSDVPNMLEEAPATNDVDLLDNVNQLIKNLDVASDENAVELVNENVATDTDLQLDVELTAIVERFKEMDEEAEKINQMQMEVNKHMAAASTSLLAVESLEEKQEADERSIYVGNVDYGATAEELESHFHECGNIKRVKIQLNKVDSRPKGFAYIEFEEKEFAALALDLNETLFRGRAIKVVAKRTNRPGMSTTNRFTRGSFRGRIGGSFRGSLAAQNSSYRGFTRHPARGRYNSYVPY